MTMPLPTGEIITLIVRSVTGRDTYGDDVYSETTSTVIGAFAPGSSTEQLQGKDIVIENPTVYLPSGTDLTPVDAIEIAGIRYEVDGSPNDWQSPFSGWAPGVVVTLQRVTG